MAFDILEGCIWFAIATAAELPQVVSLARFILLFFFFAYPRFAPQVLVILNANGSLSSSKTSPE